MTRNPDHKLLYGALLVGYVAIFAVVALVEWAWPSGKKDNDCEKDDYWQDMTG